jgi:hypothetical protein
VVAFSVQPYQQQHQLQYYGETRSEQQQQQQQQQQAQLLYVLNARSQLICWQLPGTASSTSKGSSGQTLALQLPTCKQCTARLVSITAVSSRPSRVEQRNKAAGSRTRQADAGSAAATTTAGAAAAAAAAAAVVACQAAPTPAGVVTSAAPVGSSCSSGSSSNVKPLAVYELPVQPATGLLASLAPHNAAGCSSLACPEFGNSCLFVGSSDGYLSVAELVHASSSSSSTVDEFADSGGGGGAGGSDNSSLVAGETAALLQQQQQQEGVAVSAAASAAVAAAAAANPAGSQQLTAAGDWVGGSNGSSVQGHGHCTLQLQLSSRCPLAKLAQLVGPRASKDARIALSLTAAHQDLPNAARSSRAGGAARSSGAAAAASDSNAAAAAEDEVSKVADAAGVRSAVFTACGRLAVGLASGHVCLLRFRSSR